MSPVLALQQVPITVTPQAPPGVGGAVSTLLSWLYWIAWVAVIGAGIFGGFKVATGDQESGKKYLGGAILGAIILSFLWVIIGDVVGG